MRSTREADLVRKQAEQEPPAQRAADRKAAQEAAQTQAEAERIAADNAELERRLRAVYPGSPEQWEAEKGDILRSERHRPTLAAEQQARQQDATNYQ